MADRFELCFVETLRWETGEIQYPNAPIRKGQFSYSDHPADTGGKTMCGIIQREYDAYRRRKGLPTRWVRHIEDHEIREIYRASYWDLVKGSELPPGVDLAMYDYGVNSGVSRAVKVAQRIVGTVPDGIPGIETMDAIAKYDPRKLTAELNKERRHFMRTRKVWPHFGKGWFRRMDGIEAACERMLDGIAYPPSAPKIVTEPVEVVGKVEDLPPTSMAQSSTGNTAGVVGGAGTVQLGVEVTGAVAKANHDGAFHVGDFLLALGQSPAFWIAVISIVGAVYIWIERQKKLRQHAI